MVEECARGRLCVAHEELVRQTRASALRKATGASTRGEERGGTYSTALENPNLSMSPTNDLALERDLVTRQRASPRCPVQPGLLVRKPSDPEGMRVRVRRARSGRVVRFGHVPYDGVERERVG